MSFKSAVLLLLLTLGASAAFGQEADLLAEKSGPATAPAGSNVTYSVTVTNLGPGDAATVTLADPVPAGMTFVSATQNDGPSFSCDATVTCTGASLPAGQSATFTFVFHIAGGTEFLNTAAVSSQTFDPNEENDRASVFTTVPTPSADLGVAKSAAGTATGPDQDVTFFITLTNNGPDAAEDVVLTDNLPAPLTFVSFVQTGGPPMACGTSACTVASFPAGATATFELTGHVPADAAPGTSFTNTVSASSNNDPFDENNTASTTVTVQQADLRIAKSGPATAVAGTTVTYSVTVTNDGPDVASNVVVSDPQICGALNCFIGILGSTQSATRSGSVTIPADATSWSNTATVSDPDSFDPDLSDNTSTVTTVITQSADVRVEKTGPATVVASTDATYTIAVTNEGPSDASDVVVTDTLPAGTTFVSSSCGTNPCPLGTLAAGDSAVITLTVHVAAGTAGPLSNAVAVTSSTADPNGANNTGTFDTAVTPAPADVAIVKTADAAAPAGSNLTYTLTVTNHGPGAAADVMVTDTIPAGTTFVSASPGCTGTTTVTCTVGALAANASAEIALTVNIGVDTPGPLVNTASVDASTNDPNPANDTSTFVTTVGTAIADLAIVKTANADQAPVGSIITYTIVVTNHGPGAAHDVVVTDALPPGPTLVSSSPGCTGTVAVTCTIGTLAANASATLELYVRLPSSPGTVVNTAQVSASSPDPGPGNNATTAAVNAHLPFEAVPALSPAGLAVLALTIASIVLVVLRRVS